MNYQNEPTTIEIISCVGSSSYLIDSERNLWSFGENIHGQLGQNLQRIVTPKICFILTDIQQISYGSCGHHFLARNSNGEIWAAGHNDFGQLGKGDTRKLTPRAIDEQYANIWKNNMNSPVKSARK